MNKRGPNPKIFLILTIVTVLAGSGLSYMQYNAYSEVTADVQKLKTEAKDPAEVQLELDDMIVKLNDTRAKLTHLEASVPEMEYVPTLLKELEKLGKQCGIEVTGVRPVPLQVKPAVKAENSESKKAARKPYNELDIEVKGRGNYGSAMRFINGLTTFPKIVAARTVSMQPKVDAKNGVAGAPKLDVTIELRSYLFPLDGDKVKDDPASESGEKTIDLSNRKKTVVN